MFSRHGARTSPRSSSPPSVRIPEGETVSGIVASRARCDGVPFMNVARRNPGSSTAVSARSRRSVTRTQPPLISGACREPTLWSNDAEACITDSPEMSGACEERQCLTNADSAWCSMTTPLGRPVEPDV